MYIYGWLVWSVPFVITHNGNKKKRSGELLTKLHNGNDKQDLELIMPCPIESLPLFDPSSFESRVVSTYLCSIDVLLSYDRPANVDVAPYLH